VNQGYHEFFFYQVLELVNDKLDWVALSPGNVLKMVAFAGLQWLTPVILATQEAEIRRITVQSQLGTNSLQGPISKNPSQKKGCRSGSSGKSGCLASTRSEFKPQCHLKKRLHLIQGRWEVKNGTVLSQEELAYNPQDASMYGWEENVFVITRV
jgi:hypothetical protein